VLLGAALSSLAAVAHAVVIQVGSGSGSPGDVVPIDVTVATEGSAVLRRRIASTSRAAYRGARGRAPTAVNPDIDKCDRVSLPARLRPAVDCTSVRSSRPFGNWCPSTTARGSTPAPCASRPTLPKPRIR
jgi:hypothetical protein